MLRAVANTAYIQKLRGDNYRRWIGAADAWQAGTVGGARALEMEKELGRIEVGMKADLCDYSLDAIAMVPLNARCGNSSTARPARDYACQWSMEALCCAMVA